MTASPLLCSTWLPSCEVLPTPSLIVACREHQTLASRRLPGTLILVSGGATSSVFGKSS